MNCINCKIEIDNDKKICKTCEEKLIYTMNYDDIFDDLFENIDHDYIII
jgi:hypothetical protein